MDFVFLLLLFFLFGFLLHPPLRALMRWFKQTFKQAFKTTWVPPPPAPLVESCEPGAFWECGDHHVQPCYSLLNHVRRPEVCGIDGCKRTTAHHPP